MSSLKKIKKASKYADCKNSGKESLLKYYGVKTERRACGGYSRKCCNEKFITPETEGKKFLKTLKPRISGDAVLLDMRGF